MKQQGIWRTVGGRRLFIKEGQSLDDAMKESNKFKTAKFLGDEFFGLKGKDAINKLLEEKRGYVKGAFTRKDIGDIDLIWGNEGMGLRHIIERRIKTNQDLNKVLDNIGETIEKGSLSLSRTKDGKLKVLLEHNDQRVVIGTEINDEKIQFVLSSYEIYK